MSANWLANVAQLNVSVACGWPIARRNTSAETVTTRRFVQMVFDEVGTPARMRRVPKLAINVLALFNPMMRAVSEVLYQSEYPFVVDSSKFAQAFGSHPTPHQEAIADTVGWFRQHL